METLATIELSVMARCCRQRQLARFNLNACSLLRVKKKKKKKQQQTNRFLKILPEQMAETFIISRTTPKYILDFHSSVDCDSLSCILCNFCFPLSARAAAGDVQNCHGPPGSHGRTKLPGWPSEGEAGVNKVRYTIRKSVCCGLIYAPRDVLFILKHS